MFDFLSNSIFCVDSSGWIKNNFVYPRIPAWYIYIWFFFHDKEIKVIYQYSIWNNVLLLREGADNKEGGGLKCLLIFLYMCFYFFLKYVLFQISNNTYKLRSLIVEWSLYKNVKSWSQSGSDWLKIWGQSDPIRSQLLTSLSMYIPTRTWKLFKNYSLNRLGRSPCSPRSWRTPCWSTRWTLWCILWKTCPLHFPRAWSLDVSASQSKSLYTYMSVCLFVCLSVCNKRNI